MLVIDKQPEEKQATLNEEPVELQQSEAAVKAEAEPRPVEKTKVGDGAESGHPKKRRKVFRRAPMLLVAGLAVAGYLQRGQLLKLFTAKTDNQVVTAGEHAGAGHKPELKVLYWQDPMHPAYKSDKPGKAPDCGMDLVPVYEAGARQRGAQLPSGAFPVPPRKPKTMRRPCRRE